MPCLSDVSASDLEHSSGCPIHFGMISAILLHDPISVGNTLAHDCSWFPRCILSMLYPYWHTWSEFNVVFLRLVLLPPDEFLIHTSPGLLECLVVEESLSPWVCAVL